MSDTYFLLIVFGVVALHWLAELVPAKRTMWFSELHLDPARVRDMPNRKAARRSACRKAPAPPCGG